MPIFMLCTFVFCGYLLVLQGLNNHPRAAGTSRQRALILLPVALILMVLLRVCAYFMGGPQEMLLLLAVAMPALIIGMGVRGLKRNADQVNRVMTAVFILAVLAIGYVTLFSRDGSSSTKILFGFYKIKQAFTTGSFKPLEHVLLNVILFMPIGFLLPLCCPGKSDKLFYVLAGALIFTNSIESLQYTLRIGECDLEDLVANVAGAVAGFGVLKLFVRTR